MLTFLSGPVLAVILLVLAGIALRYALWYRVAESNDMGEELDDLRVKTTSLSDEAERLRREKADLAATLQSREDDISGLRGDYDQLKREYDVLNDASIQLEVESDRQRQTVEQIESTITSLRTNHESAEVALMHESQRNEALLAELKEANVTVEELQNELSAAGEMQLQLEASRENCRDLQEALDRSQATIGRLEVDNRFSNALQEKQSSLQQAIHDGAERLESLTTERDDLAARLKTAHEEALKLRDQMASHQQRIAEIEQDRDAAIDQRDAMTSQRDEALQQRDEARESMMQERTDREAAQTRAEELTQKIEADAQALERLRATHQTLQDTVAATQSQLSAMKEERDALTNSLSNSQQRISELDKFVASMKQQVQQSTESARQIAIEKEDLVAKFDVERKELSDSIERMKSEFQDSLSSLKSERESVQAKLQSQAEAREAIEAELAEVRASKTELVDELEREQMSHRLVEKELRQEKDQYASILEQERQERLDIETTLRADLEGLRNRIEAAQQAKSQIEAELQEKANYYASVEAALRIETEELRSGSEQLRSRHETLLDEMERERHEKSVLRQDTDELRKQRERVLADLERERESRATIEAELRERAERLRYEKQSTLVELEEERDNRIQLEEALRLHTETLDKLRADSMSLEELMERQAAVQSSLAQHANSLRIYRGERTKAMDVVEPPLATDGTIPLVKTSDSSRHQDDRHVLAFGTDSDSRQRYDHALGLVYEHTPARRDDLKLISGIGEVLEDRLNELGVFTFEQVMNWNQINVAAFSKILTFKDRIERDGWIAQARRLHGEMHGERRRVA